MNKTITFGIPCYNSSEITESILEGSDYADDDADRVLMAL